MFTNWDHEFCESLSMCRIEKSERTWFPLVNKTTWLEMAQHGTKQSNCITLTCNCWVTQIIDIYHSWWTNHEWSINLHKWCIDPYHTQDLESWHYKTNLLTRYKLVAWVATRISSVICQILTMALTNLWTRLIDGKRLHGEVVWLRDQPTVAWYWFSSQTVCWLIDG